MMKKVLLILTICAMIASATVNTCDSQVESCTEYKQPIKKQSFISRLFNKFMTGASSGGKSLGDLGRGLEQTAETLSETTASGIGAISGAARVAVSSLSNAAENTVTSISKAAGAAANKADQYLTSTSISSAKKTLAKDCKRCLVHTLLKVSKSSADNNPHWGKRGKKNWGFCRSVVEKTFEKANDPDPTKHMCQFYEHIKTAYLEECNIRNIPQDLCQGYSEYTVKMYESEKSHWCAPGLVTMVR